MKSESNLVIEVWELFKEYLTSSRKHDAALSLLRCFNEFGFEAEDLVDIMDDEDEALTHAYHALFPEYDDDMDDMYDEDE